MGDRKSNPDDANRDQYHPAGEAPPHFRRRRVLAYGPAQPAGAHLDGRPSLAIRRLLDENVEIGLRFLKCFLQKLGRRFQKLSLDGRRLKMKDCIVSAKGDAVGKCSDARRQSVTKILFDQPEYHLRHHGAGQDHHAKDRAHEHQGKSNAYGVHVSAPMVSTRAEKM
ncbi:hypothetical protein AB8B21_09310 [Tardiphaga sp. 866_E4_N2_1]|uniref:hypothetical protein n=1 Tax=Tardiphaga sp. 866_E4_N2_1 TaxID=3240767 RepID=UPI003F2525B4